MPMPWNEPRLASPGGLRGGAGHRAGPGAADRGGRRRAGRGAGGHRSQRRLGTEVSWTEVMWMVLNTMDEEWFIMGK